MQQQREENTAAEIYRSAIGASDTLIIATPKFSDVAALLTALDDTTLSEPVRLLTSTQSAKAVRANFLLATTIMDHITSGTLEVRTVDRETIHSSLIVDADRLQSHIRIDDELATTVETENQEVVDAVRGILEDRWAAATAFSFRTPAYSTILRTLDDEFGESMRRDIEQVFETAMNGAAPADFDPVRVHLLVAAKNELQVYELGRWGEETGLASRAKFSREKQRLEERDLIETEKVPGDIGRPRQRLVLGPAVDEADPTALVELAGDRPPVESAVN